MRASDLRIDEKRGILKRLGQTVKSLFSNDAMRDRAVAIVADQWESDWRQFVKNKAAEKKEDGTSKYPAQDEQKNWIIYPDLFSEFIERKGVNAQVAKRIVNKVAPELSKGNKEIKPKDDVFFNEITRSLIDADALEIKDPEGLIKKVKGDAEIGDEAGAQLSPQEQANEFFGGFVSWAEEAGYAIPESVNQTGNLIVEEMGSNELTTDVVKKWLKQEHLTQSSEHVVSKFNDLIDKGDISSREGLAKLFTDIHFGMVRNFLYDAKNKKDRTPEDFNKILNTALTRYEKEDPELANTIRATAKQMGPEKAFTDNRERLEKDGLLTTDERTGSIQGGSEFEQAEEEKFEIDPKVKEKAVDFLETQGGFKEKHAEAVAAVDALKEKDLEGKNVKNPSEVAQIALEKYHKKDEESPEETVKDAAEEIVDKIVNDSGADEEVVQHSVTDVINDDPKITNPDAPIEPEKKKEIYKATMDSLTAAKKRAGDESKSKSEKTEKKEAEHKRISDIIGKNYFVRERLDPTNHQHMMYYYLADLLGAEKGDEKEEENEK